MGQGNDRPSSRQGRATARSAVAMLLCTGALAAIVTPTMVARAAGAPNDPPSPAAFFGREVGSDGVLIRHSEILAYYRELQRTSERVRVHEIGKTTLDRPFYYAVITSPDNHARLQELLADNARLYDPRGLSDEQAERIVREGKAFVIVNEQIHSTEVGASQGGILWAYRLATSDDPEVLKILDRVVVIHVPVHNPDGQEMVAEWLDSLRDTPYRNAPIPFLYHHYTGHDNNRDWYMFTQVETRLSVQMQNLFHPQFTLDQHQQGSRGSRIFVPPFEDPWEPNVDEALIAANNVIGTFIGNYLVSRGYRGVEWQRRYDGWTPARAYYHTHGGVRILTEVASANYADDLQVPFEQLDSYYRERHWNFPAPWPGGLWSFEQVVDYHATSAMAALSAAADLRPHLLRAMLAAQRRSVRPPAGAPFAFVFPAEQPDPPVAAELLRVLRIADVTVERAEEPFRAGGRDYSAGSWIVRFAQPAGRFAKSVLERQRYPEMYLYEGGPIDPPYDVTAHTLPLLMNVRVERLDEPFAARTSVVQEPAPPAGSVVEAEAGAATAYLLDPRVNASYTAAAALAGGGVARALVSFAAAGRRWPAGTFVVPVTAGPDALPLRRRLAAAVDAASATAVGVTALPENVELGWLPPVRVGIYRSYVASMPEGWLRFVFDRHGIAYTLLEDRDIRAGDLAPYGVIFVPPNSAQAILHGYSSPPMPPEYAGGIGEEGVAALRRYVQEGGVLFTWAASTQLATEAFGAPADAGAQLPRAEFNIPGSILRARFDPDHWLAYGLGEEVPIFFWRAPFWQAPAGETVARYPEGELLLSGWIQGQAHLAGKAALVDHPYGRGHVVMAGFSPEYRAQAHRTFKVLFNAVLRPRRSAHASGKRPDASRARSTA